MNSTIDILRESLSAFFTKAAEFLPNLLGALLILLVGWIIAKIVQWSIQKLLKIVKFDSLIEKAGANKFLMKGGIKKTGSNLMASLFYWIIMLTVLVTFFNSLGLDVVSNLLNSVILYIPNIIISCVLLVVGMYLAEFVSTLVVAALRNGNVQNAETFGKIAQGAVMFFVGAIVLTQLGIAESVITTIVQMTLGGVALALAIAFGFGAREWAGGVVNNFFGVKSQKNDRKKYEEFI